MDRDNDTATTKEFNHGDAKGGKINIIHMKIEDGAIFN
jgi:hypothetical protein